MKYFLWFFLLGACYAQITTWAPGGGGNCGVTGGSTFSCNTQGNAVLQAGDTVVAIASSNTNTLNPSASGCGITWPTPTKRSGTGWLTAIWVVPHVTTAQNQCTVTVSSLGGTSVFMMQFYRGADTVGVLDEPAGSVSSSSSLTAPQMTATAVGSLIVGLLASTSTTSFGTVTGVSPTVVRRSVNGSFGVMALDQEASSAGQQITLGATTTTAITYTRAAIELTPAPTNHPAQSSEAMQSVLMGTNRDQNYVLPSSGLSATWCTWFMPINTGHTYELEPQASAQINGQTSNVHIPAWQMTRICHDGTGHYWASPPLLEGTGIHLTPSPTGTTISATGGGGGGDMKWIAGGTTHLPGGVAVAAGVCTALGTTIGSSTPSATGVLTSDVVSYSLVSVADSGGTWPHILPRFIVTSANTITWNGCNQSTASVTPVARDVSWYVARHVVTPLAAHHHVAKKPARRQQ